MMTSQNKGDTPVVPWRSRPTPRRVLAGAQRGVLSRSAGGPRKRQQAAAGMTRRDLLKLLVPVVTFVAMAAPDDDDGEGETKKGSACHQALPFFLPFFDRQIERIFCVGVEP